MSKENKEYDIKREITLNEFGIGIIRFTNNQVINEPDDVLELIAEKITDIKKTISKSIINEEKPGKSPSGDLGVTKK